MPFCETNLEDYCMDNFDKGKELSYHLDFIFFQVLQGMEFIHDREIIHRDIKPENILMQACPEGTQPTLVEKFPSVKNFRHIPKISDFGISTYLSNRKENTSTKTLANKTQQHTKRTVIGTRS